MSSIRITVCLLLVGGVAAHRSTIDHQDEVPCTEDLRFDNDGRKHLHGMMDDLAVQNNNNAATVVGVLDAAAQNPDKLIGHGQALISSANEVSALIDSLNAQVQQLMPPRVTALFTITCPPDATTGQSGCPVGEEFPVIAYARNLNAGRNYKCVVVSTHNANERLVGPATITRIPNNENYGTGKDLFKATCVIPAAIQSKVSRANFDADFFLQTADSQQQIVKTSFIKPAIYFKNVLPTYVTAFPTKLGQVTVALGSGRKGSPKSFVFTDSDFGDVTGKVEVVSGSNVCQEPREVTMQKGNIQEETGYRYWKISFTPYFKTSTAGQHCTIRVTLTDAHGGVTSNEVMLELKGLDSRIKVNSIWGWWRAEDWQEGSQEWASVIPKYNGNRESLKAYLHHGTFDKRFGGGQAHGGYAGIHGYTSSPENSRLSFGDIVRHSWTLCTATAYEKSCKRCGRIIVGSRGNWLHGHWAGWAGVVYYNGWVIWSSLRPPVRRNRNSDEWTVTCTDSSHRYIVTNGNNQKLYRSTHRRISTGRARNQREIYLGTRAKNRHGGCCRHEHSEFRIGEVIAWNRGSSRGELEGYAQYMIDRIAGTAE